MWTLVRLDLTHFPYIFERKSNRHPSAQGCQFDMQGFYGEMVSQQVPPPTYSLFGAKDDIEHFFDVT